MLQKQHINILLITGLVVVSLGGWLLHYGMFVIIGTIIMGHLALAYLPKKLSLSALYSWIPPSRTSSSARGKEFLLRSASSLFEVDIPEHLF